MVARPPLNLAVMVAGSGLGSWAQAPERSETEPLEGQWPDQAGLAGGLDLPASESAKSSDNHSHSLPPPFFLKSASDSAEHLPIEDWVCAPYPAPLRKEPLLSPTLRQLLVQTSSVSVNSPHPQVGMPGANVSG